MNFTRGRTGVINFTKFLKILLVLAPYNLQNDYLMRTYIVKFNK